MKKLPLSLRIYLLFSVLFIFVFYPSSYAQSDSSTVGTDSIKMVDSLMSEKESVQTAEDYLKGLLSSFGDQFGLNGYMHHIVSETIVDEASAFKNSIQTESPFQLYPFSYTSSISINPNNNFFLLRGPSIDLSQTHTTLPNYNLTAKIDSSQNYYIFQDQFGGVKYNNSFKQKTVVERKDYFTENFTNELRSSFTKSVASSLSKQEEKTGGAVRLFTASVSTNETFQKIFGGDEVAVDATGNINLNVSGASEKSSNQNQTTGKTSQFTPKFEQKQQFNLRGTIGRKVEILFDQDSEREFDFENNIKLTYTGFDDEILQKLEAGNIDLSLPGTEFVTTGGQNKGLFGVKALFKLANLNLTTIASLQRGEKTKLKFKGGSEQGTTIKKSSYEYAKAKFFFLDNSYRDNYEKYQARYQHTYFPEKEIVAIKVFKASQNNQKVPGSIQGTALTNTSILADPNNVNLSFDALKQLDPTAQSGWFLEMIKGSDYTYDSRLGIVTMTSPIQLGDILAVWYQTQDGTEIGNTDTTNLLLKMLWSNNPGPSHPTWDLELKNIYDLGVTGLSEEDIRTLKIKFKPNGVNNELTVVNDLDNKSRGIMEILHIDEAGETSGGPDNIVDKEVIDFGRGYLVFPRLRPFDPDATNLSGFSNETYPFVIGTDSVRFPNFYDLDRGFQSDQKNRTANQFSIELTTTKKTSTITLGFNVLEGSEEVILNGTPLQKDVDYVIDYFSGSIELLNQAALLPNADLEINYEQAQLFQIDKKSIFGARAEYNLSEHGFGQNSFIGTTALFQSQSTINKRVQLGEEPYNNFVWDVNTNLEFNAKYLTNFVNYIPLVSSNQPSKINIRAEYAKILPNPNTSNGLIRQNENGVSYIDDFEAVKRTFPLGTTRRSWALSSIPTFKDSSMRGKIIWFQNQEEKQKLSQIDVNQSERVTILEIALKPQTRNPSRISESWGGIMKGFSISAAKELAETKFVELWIKNENNQKARVTIDLGAISEDQNSNNELDKEIKSGLQIGISDDEDVGLDNYSKAQEDSVLNSYGIIPGSTNLTEEQQKIIDSLQIIYPWGVINASAEDPFGDDWIADQAKLEFVDDIKKAIKAGNIDQIKVNGLEENVTGKEFDGTTKFGDTEDLDANGVIDLNNSFFRYSFSIDPNSADTNLVIGKGKDPNWRLYRIPISRPDTAINNPSLQNIRNARLWVSPETNDPSIISFQLAEMQFVSSEWTFPEENPNGLVLPPNIPPLNADDAAKIIEISYANTEETIFYEKPDNVKNEYVSGQAGNNRDRQVKEQSLSLKLNNLPSKASAVIIKNIQSSDLRNYGRIRMFVHGDTRGNLTLPLEEVQTDQSPIRFFFRFGGDKNNYFEIEQPLFADWAEKKNSIDIDFSDLSKKKFDASVSADSLNTKTFDLGEGKILRIKGNPSTASIRQLYIGAINDENSTPYTGEIWVNELRVSDVNDAPGHAAKAALVFNLADFASFSGLLQYRTSEFRTIDQRFDANSGDSRNWNFGGSFNLHKFYIERWGINLPLSFNFSHNQVDPKYVPNDDILVKDARKQNELNLNTLQNRSFVISDSLNYLNSIGGDTSYIHRLEHEQDSIGSRILIAENFDSRIRTINTSRGFSLSFSKAKNENNYWLLRYTIDNVTSNFNYTVSESKSPVYVNNRNKNWTSATTYNLGIKKRSFKIFNWMPLTETPFIGSIFKNLQETDFNYSFLTNMATDFSITSTRTEITERDARGLPVEKPLVSTLTANRGYSLGISPWQSLNSTIAVKYQSDLRGLSSGQILKGVAKGLNPFDGFDDFQYRTAIDTIKGKDDADSLIFNRDYSTANSFNLSYSPTSFRFLTHTLTYTSTHSLARQRPPQTIFNQAAQLTRRVQLDMTYSIRNFISSVGESFEGGSKQKQPTGGQESGRRGRRDKFKSLSSGNTETDESQDSTQTENTFKKISRKFGSLTEKALNMINDVRFNTSFDNSVTLSGLDQRPDPAMMWFGYTTTPTSDFMHNLFSFNLDTIDQFNKHRVYQSQGLFTYQARKTLNYGFTYGFNFIYFTVDLRFDYTESRGLGTNNTETRTKTTSTLFPWLQSSPLPIFYDLTFRASNIGRWPIFNLMSGLTNNINFNFNYNSKKTRTFSEYKSEKSNGIPGKDFISNNRKFQTDNISNNQTFPQMGFDIMWKGGITQNVTFTNTNIENTQQKSRQTSNSKSITSTLSYVKRGGFRLPLWFLKNKQLNNEVRISNTFAYNKRVSFNYNTTLEIPEKKKTDEATIWSVEPRIDYSFTSRLTGGMFFKYESNKSLIAGKITRILAGINVNISIGT